MSAAVILAGTAAFATHYASKRLGNVITSAYSLPADARYFDAKARRLERGVQELQETNDYYTNYLRSLRSDELRKLREQSIEAQNHNRHVYELLQEGKVEEARELAGIYVTENQDEFKANLEALHTTAAIRHMPSEARVAEKK
ncbi:MAG: hypothetical protein HYW25_01475 [Candidatus Aenigmarchaeota archaeon]|nr:hypothetical protein [Candidatus Aenigmarchaeota archaeon]